MLYSSLDRVKTADLDPITGNNPIYLDPWEFDSPLTHSGAAIVDPTELGLSDRQRVLVSKENNLAHVEAKCSSSPPSLLACVTPSHLHAKIITFGRLSL